nr:MAG TPA: hypothetical protein [Caudoviricetes sp.]
MGVIFLIRNLRSAKLHNKTIQKGGEMFVQ